jgi:hypothetical protein
MQPAPRRTATNLALRNSRRKIELGQFGSIGGRRSEGGTVPVAGDRGDRGHDRDRVLSERPLKNMRWLPAVKLTVPNRIEPARNREPRPWVGRGGSGPERGKYPCDPALWGSCSKSHRCSDTYFGQLFVALQPLPEPKRKTEPAKVLGHQAVSPRDVHAQSKNGRTEPAKVVADQAVSPTEQSKDGLVSRSWKYLQQKSQAWQMRIDRLIHFDSANY